MTMYMASPAREGKKLNDVIFQAGAKVQAAIAAYGKERVVNGTLGAFADDEGNVACIPTVETLFRSMDMRDFICYAPPVGLPAYRDAVLSLCRPKTRCLCGSCGFSWWHRCRSYGDCKLF